MVGADNVGNIGGVRVISEGYFLGTDADARAREIGASGDFVSGGADCI